MKLDMKKPLTLFKEGGGRAFFREGGGKEKKEEKLIELVSHQKREQCGRLGAEPRLYVLRKERRKPPQTLPGKKKKARFEEAGVPSKKRKKREIRALVFVDELDRET